METALYLFKRQKEIGPGWLLDRCEDLTVNVRLQTLGPEVALPMGIQCRGVVIVGLPLPPDAVTKRDPAVREQQIFVRSLVALAVPFLGIGYGAQLLTTALLGKVLPQQDDRIGAATLSLTDEGRVDPLLSEAPSVPVIRWPTHRLELPPRAVLLSGPPNRPDAFRLGDCAWAVLPHPEVTARGFSDWLCGAHADLVSTLDTAALKAAADSQQDAQRAAAHRLMDRFLFRVNAFHHAKTPLEELEGSPHRCGR